MLSANSGLYRIAKSDISIISNIIIQMSLIYKNYISDDIFELHIIKYTRNSLALTGSYNIQNTTFLVRCFNV